MKKKLSLLIASTMIFSLLVSCADKKEDKIETKDSSIEVAALKGPTGMGLIKMIDDEKKSEDGKYNFTLVGSPDEITPKLVSGEIDIAAIPANLASVLYNNTDGEVVTLAINTLGVLYIVENGNTINSIEDLKGKTIYASGKGSTPEYALNYILEQAGIMNEVKVEYKSEHSECLSALVADENGIAMLPEPFVTSAITKNSDLRVALDLNSEWESLTTSEESALITGVIVARKEFLENKSEEIDEFLNEYSDSVEYTNENISEASILIEENNIISAEVASKAIPKSNITLIEGEEMKQDLEGYLEILYEANSKAVGGQLPGEDFYYIK